MSDFSFKLSEHSEENITQSLSLIKQSFGNTDIASRDYYNWQYLRNPVGKGNVLIAYYNSEPAGQFATIPCLYKFNTEEVIIPLTLNLCVLPKFRGQGLMSQLMSRMHQILSDGAEFSIGVPNKASIAGHLKNGYFAFSLPLLARPIKPSLYFENRVIRTALNPFDSIWRKDFHDPEVALNDTISKTDIDQFLQRHSSRKTLIQIRSSSYLDWRYWQNPSRKYGMLTYYDDNRNLLGYVVVRITKIFGKRVGIIVDLAVTSREVGRKLLVNTLGFFWKRDVAFAICSTFSGTQEFSALKRSGFYLVPQKFRPHPLALCIKILDKGGLRSDTLKNFRSWFFMIGDNDAM